MGIEIVFIRFFMEFGAKFHLALLAAAKDHDCH